MQVLATTTDNGQTTTQHRQTAATVPDIVAAKPRCPTAPDLSYREKLKPEGLMESAASFVLMQATFSVGAEEGGATSSLAGS